MALNFPNSPANNQIYFDATSGNRYKYNAVANVWFFVANNDIQGSTGDTQVIFNDGNSSNGSFGLTFNKTANTLTANTINAFSMRVTGNLFVGTNTVVITDNSIFAETINATTMLVGGTAIPTGQQSNAVYNLVNVAFGVANSAFAAGNAEFTFSNTIYAAVNSAFAVINAAYTSSNADFTLTNAAFTQSNTDNVRLTAAFGVANAAFGLANTRLASSGGTISGDLVVTGNLTTSGVTTYANTQTLLIGDNILTLNADLPAGVAATENAGIEVNRGAFGNSSIIWDEANDKWDVRVNNNTAMSVAQSGNVGIGIGAQVPSYPVIISSTDTTVATLAVAISGNPRVGIRSIVGGQYGSIDLGSGQNITWLNSTNLGGNRDTGLSRGAAGTIYVNTTSADGAGKLIAGKIGVANTNPFATLEVDGWQQLNGGTTQLRLFPSGDATYIGTATSHKLNFRTGSADRMTIDTAGNVGIGTTSPLSALHANTADNNWGSFVSSPSGAVRIGGYITGFVSPTIQGVTGNGGAYQRLFIDAANIAFGIFGTTRAFIDSSGQVGIGTSSNLLYGRLTVSGGNQDQWEFNSSSVTYNGGTLEYINRSSNTNRPDMTFYVGAANSNMKFATAGAERMRLDSSGNLGIGTTSPAGKLHVTQNTAGTNGLLVNMPTATETTASGIRVFGYSPAIELMDKDSVQNWFMGIDDDDGNKLVFARGYGPGQGIAPAITITPSDNVGIGTTSPGAKLNVRDGRTYLEAASEPYSLYVAHNSATSGAFLGGTSTGGFQLSAAGGGAWVNVDSSGRVTMPFQPAFSVTGPYTGGFWTISASAGSGYVIIYTGVHVNRGSHYNTSNGRFTAPIAGVYFFSASITSAGAYSGPGLFIRVNGTAQAGNILAYTSTGYCTACQSWILPLNAGDYVDVSWIANNIATAIDMSRATFTGHLLG